MHYIKVRRAIDPAIIYFKDVVTTYPATKAARMSWLRLHGLYTKIRWKEDAAETCTAMWKAYPGDPEVALACGAAPKDTAAPVVRDTTALKADTIAAAPQPAILSPVAFARPAPNPAP